MVRTVRLVSYVIDIMAIYVGSEQLKNVPASPSACIRVFRISNGYNAEALKVPPIQALTTSEATDGIVLGCLCFDNGEV